MAYAGVDLIPEDPSDSPGWSLPASTPSAVPNSFLRGASNGKSAVDKKQEPYCHPFRLEGHKEPLKASGSLDQFKSIELTPNLGTEFPDVNLVDLMKAPNSEQLLRDLAILISRRGVVFFRAQDDMSLELQKQLAQTIGLQSGKPAANTLHIFPLVYKMKALKDDEITVISYKDPPPSEKGAINKVLGDISGIPAHRYWHSDAMFEHVPGDYSVLRFEELPKIGGDTLWASTYEIYDRLSRPMQSFLESLTFTGGNPAYHAAAAAHNIPYYTDPRGAPENVGKAFRATHPVVRTNPVTGWNGIYPFGPHVEFINGMTRAESQRILDWLHEMAVMNHDNHVRFRWINKNDMALWDNRSMLHTTTPDHQGKNLGDRVGYRAMSVGERPYFDPLATGRAEALAREEVGHRNGVV